MRITLILLVSLLFVGCSSKEARHSLNMQQAAVLSNNANLKKIIATQSNNYLENELKRADDAAEASIAAETKPDGSANVKNLEVITNIKAQHYKKAMEHVQKTNEAVKKTDQDLKHFLQYNEGLMKYFDAQESRAKVIDESFNLSVELLDRFLHGKKEKKK